jgi:hypothetical protein
MSYLIWLWQIRKLCLEKKTTYTIGGIHSENIHNTFFIFDGRYIVMLFNGFQKKSRKSLIATNIGSMYDVFFRIIDVFGLEIETVKI